jgi:hypothetical protein
MSACADGRAGKESKTDLETKKVLQQTSVGTLYEQSLALQSCYGSWDVAPALQALASPSSILGNSDIYIIAVTTTDDVFES